VHPEGKVATEAEEKRQCIICGVSFAKDWVHCLGSKGWARGNVLNKRLADSYACDFCKRAAWPYANFKSLQGSLCYVGAGEWDWKLKKSGHVTFWFLLISPGYHFATNCYFYGQGLRSHRPSRKLEDHPSSAVRDCLFSIFSATLHIWDSLIRNSGMRQGFFPTG